MRLAPLSFAFLAALTVVPLAAQQQSVAHLSTANVSVLRLSVTGDLVLKPEAGLREVQIVGEFYPGRPPLNVQSTRSGAQLDITLRGPERSALPFGPSGHAFQVTFPAGLRLEVRQFGGSVRLTNPAAPVEIYDADGDIAIDGPRKPVVAEADSGDVSVTAARAGLELTAENGRVQASLAPGWSGNEIRLESTAGDLLLSVPQGFAGDYDLTSGSGKITNPLRSEPHAPLVFMLSERGNVTVTLDSRS
jgi:hypothetical protein